MASQPASDQALPSQSIAKKEVPVEMINVGKLSSLVDPKDSMDLRRLVAKPVARFILSFLADYAKPISAKLDMPKISASQLETTDWHEQKSQLTALEVQLEIVKKSCFDLHPQMVSRWNAVIKESADIRATVEKRQQTLDKSLDMINAMLTVDDIVPMQGRWITFPLWNNDDVKVDNRSGDKLTVKWLEGNLSHEAVYYKTTCWFGNVAFENLSAAEGEEVKLLPEQQPQAQKPEEKKAPSEGPKDDKAAQPGEERKPSRKASLILNPFGETALYIAAEFIEHRYKGAPHLRGKHLRDIFPTKTNWAYLRLGDQFHYGQNRHYSPTYRYLVYHPFAVPRNVPQRSFADNVIIATAKAMLKVAGDVKNETASNVGKGAGALLEVVTSVYTDKLCKFERLSAEQLKMDVAIQQLNLQTEWFNAEQERYRASLDPQREMRAEQDEGIGRRQMDEGVKLSTEVRETEAFYEHKQSLQEINPAVSNLGGDQNNNSIRDGHDGVGSVFSYKHPINQPAPSLEPAPESLVQQPRNDVRKVNPARVLLRKSSQASSLLLKSAASQQSQRENAGSQGGADSNSGQPSGDPDQMHTTDLEQGNGNSGNTRYNKGSLRRNITLQI